MKLWKNQNVRNGNIWKMKVKGGSRRKEIRIMLGNDRRSKMPTAPISFSMNHFFLFHSGKNNFFHEPLFPFSLGQKYFFSVNHFFLFHLVKKLFFYEPLFPFSLGQKCFLWTPVSFFHLNKKIIFVFELHFPFFTWPKKDCECLRPRKCLFLLQKCSFQAVHKNENKNGNFSRRVAFLKKPLLQQFLALKCSKLSPNFPPSHRNYRKAQ